MPGSGTIVNAAAIIIGGLLGLLVKRFIKESFQKTINAAMALSIIAMSVSDMVAHMLVVSDAAVSTRGTYMMIASLVLGGIIGELADLDGKMEQFGRYLKEKTGNAKDAAFVDAFVTSSLTVCIGAMAVMGAIMDGIKHDYSILFTKAILDFVIIMVMSASMGKGCIFSAIPMALFQGFFTALSVLIAPFLNELAMDNLSIVGSVLILCIGVNLLGGGKFKIKVANLLPAIVFAVLAAYVPFLR